MVNLALSVYVNVRVEKICTSHALKLNNVNVLPGASRRERRSPIPAKVGLFFANEPTIEELKDSLDTGRPF
jgi:hypothetical protein